MESTFSITTIRAFSAGLFGLPVIKPAERCDSRPGRTEKRAMVIEDAIAIRSMIYLYAVLRRSPCGRRCHCPSIHGAREAHARKLD